MKWTVTKRYFRGNAGTSVLNPEYNFKIGRRIGPKSIWDKLREEEEGWKFNKSDGEYVFTNYHLDESGNSWGRSEVVLTYFNYSSIYECLDEWLKKASSFEVWCNDNEFELFKFQGQEYFNVEEVREIVRNYISFNFPEEVQGIVAQEVTAGIDGELFCNNPYASPEYSLEWNSNDKEFKITINSPSSYGSGYIPFESELIIGVV